MRQRRGVPTHRRRVGPQGPWRVVLPLVLFGCVLRKTLFAARVSEGSMLPTLRDGDCVLGVRVPHGSAPVWQPVRDLVLCRGTIVLVRPPAHGGRLHVKRIAAVPGDQRTWGWGPSSAGPGPIPTGHVFVLGDATRRAGLAGPSADSRGYGPCPAAAVVAWVFLRFWPLTRFGYLRRRAPGGG